MPNEDDNVFGHEPSIQSIFLEGNIVPHIVKPATRISIASFLYSNGKTYGQSVEGIWFSFVQTRFIIYAEYPYRTRTDEGSSITL